MNMCVSLEQIKCFKMVNVEMVNRLMSVVELFIVFN